jgi:hypothetical protein
LSDVTHKIPTGRKEKVQFLYDLYRASQYHKDTDIFEEIRRLTDNAISIPQLKRYKKDNGWAKPKPAGKTRDKPAKKRAEKKTKNIVALPSKRTKKKTNRARIKPRSQPLRIDPITAPPKQPKPPPVEPAAGSTTDEKAPADTPPGGGPHGFSDPAGAKTKTIYTEAEKMKLVNAISAAYSTDGGRLEDICKAYGITRKTYWKWITDNPVLNEIHQSGINDRHLERISNLQDATINALMRNLTTTQLCYERTIIEIVPDFDKQGNAIYKEVPKRIIRDKKDVLTQQASIMNGYQVMNQLLATTNSRPSEGLEDLSIEDLQLRLEEINKKLNEPNNTASA